MGGKKVSIEPILDLRKRNIAFKRRKAGLIKKARELAILCDVDVSMIIFSDQQENNPEIFPPDNPHKLNDSINAYKSKRAGKIKSYGLQDFFKDRKRKAEDELITKAKKSQFGVLDNSSQGELSNFACELGTKIDHAHRRIESVGKDPQTENLGK